MIIGVGTDLVAIDRVAGVLAQHGQRFINRVFADDEQKYAPHDADAPAHYAKRWAAKEALSKALGVGINAGVYLRDIVVTRGPQGAPHLTLRGGAAAFLASRAGGNARLHLSLSDDAGLALAFVVIET